MSFLEQDAEMQDFLGIVPPKDGPVTGNHQPVTGDYAIVGGAYDGAERFSNEMLTWQPSMSSADGDLLGDKPLLDARGRDVAYNDAYVKSAIGTHKDGVVGAQYRLNLKPNLAILGLDEKWAEEFQEEVEAKFNAYVESTSGWIDASRRMTLTDQVRMAVGVRLMTGEFFAVADYITDERDRPFATAMQIIDGDRVSDPPFAIEFKENLRGGILHNSRGRPLGYYIRKRHPGDPYSYRLGMDDFEFVSTTTRWGRQKVIHIYDAFRPEQSRGVSSMVAALKELRMSKRYRDVALQSAVVNATYAASIESELPSEAVFSQMGGGDKDLSKAITNYAGAYMSALNGYVQNNRSAYLNGVKVPHFFPGTKLQLRPASSGDALGGEFESSLLRYIAADLDISYEQLTGDFRGINYSTLKGSINETQKGMAAIKKHTADRYANHVLQLWMEEAFAKNEITSLPRNAPNFWEGLNREAYCQAEWIGGSKGQIDELKETQAAVLRLKYNLSTDEDESARLGKDWRQLYAQRAREKKARKDLDIESAEDLANDNMMNATTGAPREKSASDEPEDSSDEQTDA